MYSEAAVCGRFQPPHNDHLQYILEAKSRCEFLWIGIVQPDVRRIVPCAEAVHRAEKIANPLTYFERVQIITGMLRDVDVSRATFACTPFPLDESEVLPDFLPISIPCFTTICDPWNYAKINRLKQVGYTVEILFERQEKVIEGKDIRASILAGSRDWEAMVPPATIQAVHKLELAKRMVDLAG